MWRITLPRWSGLPPGCSATRSLNPELGRVAVVLAMMADKDVLGMITALEYCVDIWYIAQVDQARSMAADEVAQTMKGVGIRRESGPDFAIRQCTVGL